LTNGYISITKNIWKAKNQVWKGNLLLVIRFLDAFLLQKFCHFQKKKEHIKIYPYMESNFWVYKNANLLYDLLLHHLGLLREVPYMLKSYQNLTILYMMHSAKSWLYHIIMFDLWKKGRYGSASVQISANLAFQTLQSITASNIELKPICGYSIIALL